MEELINKIYTSIHSMWAYRWSALLIAWILSICSLAVIYGMPNQYKAKATVYIDTSSIMKPLLKGLAVDTDASADLAMVKQVLLSRETLKSVIRETDMDLEADTPVEIEQQVVSLAQSIELISSSDKKRRRRGGGQTFEIAYQSTSADRVYQVVSKLLNELIENTLGSNRADTKMAQSFLSKQIADYEKRLREAEEQLADFKKKNVGLMPDEKGNYYDRLQRAVSELKNTKSQLRRARQKHSELVKQVRGETAILDNNLTGDRLRNYQEQLSELQSRFTDQHPDVLALKARITDLLENKPSSSFSTGDDGVPIAYNPVYQELKILASDASVEVGSLSIQYEEQQQQVEALKESVDAIPQVEAELSRLNRDYEITKDRYLSLIGRLESARLTEQADQNRSEVTFRVIEPPVVPLQPSGPNRPLLLAAALLLALAAGLGWSYLRTMLHPTYTNFSQLKENIGLPVLGAVSLYRDPTHIRQRKLQLMAFMLSIIVLFAGFGGAVLYQDSGSALVMGIMGQSGLSV